MKQKKIGTTLYVFDTTAYQITEDTDATVIKIQEECIPAYAKLNPTLVSKFSPINYKLFCVQKPEWADYLDDYTVSVSVTGNGAVSASPTSADEGEEIILTVTPESGYELNTMTAASGGTAITITDNKFTMPAGNVTVTATFQGQEFDITCAEATHGSVSAPSTARLGDTVTITTTPDTNYRLDTLTAMCGEVPVTITDNAFTMPAGDVTITATFVQDVNPYSLEYFTIESEADNNEITITQDIIDTFYVSIDGGSTWLSSIEDGGGQTYTQTLDTGDKMLIKANNGGFNIYYDPESVTDPIIDADDGFKVYGNSMSLIYGDNFVNQTSFPADSTSNLKGSLMLSKVTDASNLILPATTLDEHCYESMFSGCTNLTNAPVLPATILAGSCYKEMFSGCTSLVTAPELPATTLTVKCYSSMFKGCTSLVTAPELPATTLRTQCYSSMFSGCTSLNYIKCLATNISASGCTISWVYNVSSTGTFVKDSSMSSWSEGTGGIPSGWTVENYVPES